MTELPLPDLWSHCPGNVTVQHFDRHEEARSGGWGEASGLRPRMSWSPSMDDDIHGLLPPCGTIAGIHAAWCGIGDCRQANRARVGRCTGAGRHAGEERV